jgi:outer membrane protein
MEASLFALLGLAMAQAEGSLTLARALELVRTHHQTHRLAEAEVERAEAVRSQALSALLPEVAIEGRYTRQPERSFDTMTPVGTFSTVIQEENVASGRASFNITLLEARNFVVLQRAGPAFESVEVRAKETEYLLDFQVAEIFLAVLSSEQLAEAARNRIAVAIKAKEDAQKKFEHGMSGSNDVTRAELELATAELLVTDAEGAIRDLRLQLERYVGEAARTPLVPPAELFTGAEASAEELTRRAHETRPDVVALKADAEAARISANEPLWGLVPSLKLDAFYDLTTQKSFTGENTGWGVTLSANWILYDRGRRYREADERTALAHRATLQLERGLEDATADVQRALVRRDRSKFALDRAEARLALSKKNAEEVAVRYREGVASAFELADANAQEFAANAEVARARFDLGVSILTLRRASGSSPL